MKSFRILIADDHVLFRKGLVAALREIRPHWEFAEAEDGKAAIALTDSSTFNMLLMDVQMPNMGGIESTRRIKATQPDLPVIVLTQYDEPSLILHFLQLGVNGFLSKNTDPEELVEAIDIVIAKGKFVNEQMLRAMEISVGTTADSRVRLDLTTRDKEIIVLLKQGKNSKQIASQLHLSEASIESYRKELLHKTRTHNVAELVSLVHRTGLI